jgi:hypothetical protein
MSLNQKSSSLTFYPASEKTALCKTTTHDVPIQR